MKNRNYSPFFLAIPSIIVVLFLLIVYLGQIQLSIRSAFFYVPLMVLFIFSIFVNMGKANKLLWIAMLMCLMFTLNSKLYKTDDDILSVVIHIWFWVFPFSFAQLINKEYDKKMICVVLVVVYLAISVFLYSKYIHFDYSESNKFYEITTIYYLILALPFIMTIKTKLIKYPLVLLIFLAGFFSFKRNAILVLGVILLLYLLRGGIKKIAKKIVLFSAIIALSIVILVAFRIVSFDQMYSIWIHRFTSSDTMLGSRGEVYVEVLDLLTESSPFELLFGHGYNAVMSYTTSGLSAHNDFLEVLFDYGLIPFVIYIYFIVKLILHYIKMRKSHDNNSFAFLCSLSIFIVLSLFSHLIIYPTYFLLLSMFWGWILPSKKYKNHANKFASFCSQTK